MKRSRIIALVFVGILLCEQVVQPIRVSALDDNLRQFYSSNDISMFDPNDCTLDGFGATGAVALKGDTTIEQILSFFMSQENGLTLAQAAGIVGNMAQESPHGVDEKTGVNLPNPAKIQGGAIADDKYTPQNGVGFGLVQWTFTSRQKPLVELAARENKKIIDLDLQLQYVWQELNGGYSHALEELRRAKYPVEAAIAVHGPPWPGYEASADSPEKVKTVRGGNAQKVYDYYKDAPSLGEPGSSPNINAAMAHPKSSDPCSSAFGGGNLEQTLLAYAWPTYKGNDREATEDYKTAVQKARSEGRYVGGTMFPGIDCGGFVTTLLIDSGREPNYNYEGQLAKGAGATSAQQAWLEANWEKLSPAEVLDTSNREPGEVAINSTHTYIYVGTVSGFESQIASASWGANVPANYRAPMAGKERVDDTNFTWYRQKSSTQKKDTAPKPQNSEAEKKA